MGAFRVGDIRIDPSRNVIANGAGSWSLEPKVMDLLVLLAAHPEEVLSRETLIDRVWKVEFGADESLTRAVSLLRRAFRDAGHSGELIETIPKRGYRFAAAVRQDAPPAVTSASPPMAPPEHIAPTPAAPESTQPKPLPQTRLVAIVGVDVAGYSARTEADPQAAADQIRRLRIRLGAIAASNGGRVFNTSGDGAMLEFSSARAAMAAIRNILDDRPADEPGLRIGAHLGDVFTAENNDLLGHGVNVAARLMAMAQPYTAMISGELRAALGGDPDARLMRSMGEVALPKMATKVVAFELSSESTHPKTLLSETASGSSAPEPAKAISPPAGSSAARRIPRMGIAALAAVLIVGVVVLVGVLTRWGAPAQERSIAVLPFASESVDTERAYLGRVLAGEIIEILSQLKGMEVIARNSSFTFQPETDVLEVGRKLGVSHVLSGTVREEGDTINVSVTLADAKTGRVIWTRNDAPRFTPEKVPVLQKDIAERVAGAMSIAFNVPASSRLTGGSTKSFEAYDNYLRGLSYWWDGGPALEAFTSATALDPDYAEAWAGQAVAAASETLRIVDPKQAREDQKLAYAMAERGVQLAPELAVTQACYGALSTTQGKWRQAELATVKAMEISRGEMSMNHRQNTLMRVGRSAEAYDLMLEQKATDPFINFGAFRNIGVLPATGREDELFDIATKYNWFGSKGAVTQIYGLMARIQAGRTLADIRESLQSLAQQPDPSLADFASGLIPLIDNKDQVRAYLRKVYGDASLQHSSKWELLPILAAWAGDDELVLRVWQDNLPVNTMRTIFIWADVFSGARSRPEFKQLARDIGFVDYWRTYRWADKCKPLAGDDFECR